MLPKLPLAPPRWSPTRLWALALAGLAALLCWRPILSNDAYWHLMLGRAVLENGSRTVPEPTAFAAFPHTVVVPEWLWGVLTYLVHQASGPTGLTLLVMALAFIATYALVSLLATALPGARPAAMILVSGLAMVAFIHWFRLRPQALFLTLLPLFLLCTHLYLRNSRDRRLWLALVAMQLLWAQAHGSFVLGPALFTILLLPQLLRRGSSTERSRHLGLFLLLLAASLTSAYGSDIGVYILHHSGGYATTHIGDMKAPNWSSLDPTQFAANAAYCLLWLLALIGILIAPRAPLGHILLALLGLALFSTAVRFLAASAILTAPLALRGATTLFPQLPARAPARPIALLMVALLTGWKWVEIDDMQGPLGRMGFGEGRFPVVAGRYLEGIPPGSNVLTSYISGGAIGFWQHGRVRTFVDSRTPLHFDNTDFALAEQAWSNKEVLALTLKRYGAEAGVVERNTRTCDHFAKLGWHAVAIEPRYTTFSRDSSTPGFDLIAPCGAAFLAADACRDGGEPLEAEIERLGRLGTTPFIHFLHAAQGVECGLPPGKRSSLPPRWAAWEYRDQYDLYAARQQLANGDRSAAMTSLRRLTTKRDIPAINAIMKLFLNDTLTPQETRELIGYTVESWGEETPPQIRDKLALLCMGANEAECVRFHGLQAAIHRVSTGETLLRWLAEHHPDSRVRADATAWLEVITSTGGGNTPPHP